MVNGQIAPWLATHGGTIPVPFLIGTEGWALFVHGPWGEFDLRDGKGRFLPRTQAKGKEPLQLFVIGLEEPGDALAEYIRLTGRPVMPPKWALGYMQSHRTLADPKEPAQIVRTFRAKKLPLDAVIYLGTGYCPAGWNTGHGSLEFNPKTFDNPAQNLKALHDETAAALGLEHGRIRPGGGQGGSRQVRIEQRRGRADLQEVPGIALPPIAL
jgi:alpha-glucosidase/alpha-D-xyloside xylohydrolase